LTGVETRLFLVPRSLADRTPVGLLVLPGSAAVSSAPGGVACKVVAGRLYAPVDATLHPPVSDGELRALCPLPVAFFHPAFGLSGFEEECALRVSDLIERPEERGADWNFARRGEPPLPELTAIVLARQPTLEEVFG